MNATTGTTAQYLYDPMGRRQAKIVGSVTTSFLSDGAEEIAEYDGAGGLLRRYIPGPGTDQPIAMVTPSGGSHLHSYFHTNRQGSTVAMSNDAGTVSEGPYTYDAYGQGAPSTGVPFKYTGRRLDPETGLYYYRARYYSAALGRFLQTDPIGYADQMNLYAYVANDPSNKQDPTGECATVCIGAIAGFFAEAVVQVVSGDWDSKEVFDSDGSVKWEKVGRNVAKLVVSTAAGAASGGLSVLQKGGSLARVAGLGYAKSVVNGVAGGVNAKIDGKDNRTAAIDAVASGLGSRIGDAAGEFYSAVAGKSSSASAIIGAQIGKQGAQKVVSKAVSETVKPSDGCDQKQKNGCSSQ